MNKQELAEELVKNVAGVSHAQAEKLLDALTRTVTERLRAGEEVVLAGFGAFSARKRKGRIGVNPRNVSEKIEIPAVTVAKFKPGKNLKDSLKSLDRPSMNATSEDTAPEEATNEEAMPAETASETSPEPKEEQNELPTNHSANDHTDTEERL